MKFHHIGLAVSNIQDEIKYYRSIGAVEFSKIFNDEIQNVRIAFFMLGGIRYELVSPLSSGSPVDNLLKNKKRIYHTCYEVLDLEDKINFFQNLGALLVLPPTRAVALDNRRVSFLLTRPGDLIELMESSDEG